MQHNVIPCGYAMAIRNIVFREGVLTPCSGTSPCMDDDGELLAIRGKLDRRVSAQNEPPFFTEEGFVVIDRRDGCDRRLQSMSH
jgi:hypothetical protein